MINSRFLFLISICWLFVCQEPAQAYLDPGTGSFLIQLLVGSMLAGVATMKLWWGKVTSLFKPKPKD